MCTGPAGLAGLSERKGALATGFDADIAIWNPDATFVVDPTSMMHRHPVTPYAGRTLHGIVQRTFVKGAPIGIVH
jgi:allantoinase